MSAHDSLSSSHAPVNLVLRDSLYGSRRMQRTVAAIAPSRYFGSSSATTFWHGHHFTSACLASFVCVAIVRCAMYAAENYGSQRPPRRLPVTPL